MSPDGASFSNVVSVPYRGYVYSDVQNSGDHEKEKVSVPYRGYVYSDAMSENAYIEHLYAVECVLNNP